MPVPAVNFDRPGNCFLIPSLIDCLRKNLIYKMWLPYTHRMSILGRFVKNRRIALAEKHSGYSMRSVAKRIGIHHSYLSRLERGEYAPLSEERIRALAVLFGEDPELLMAIGGRLSDHIANLIASNPDKFLHFVKSMEEQAEYSKNEYLQRLTRRKEELETPIGICTANAQHQYISMNSSYAHLYGYSSPQEMMNVRSSPLDVFVSSSDKVIIQTLLKNNNIVTRFECKTRRKDESIFLTTRTIRGIHDKYGNIEYYKAFVEYITERKK